MTKLTLKFEERVLKEILVGPQVIKIGRLPDNTVMIDNPAVSSHHARVFREADKYILEDLESTNGTFVNEQRVTRHTLQNGDVVQVGKHKLVFEHTGAEEPVPAPGEVAPSEAEPMIPELGGTVFLDTKAQRELLAKMATQQKGAETPTAPLPSAAAAAKVGVLTVLAGRADQSEYVLEAATCLIGKSDTALVRLKGWFKPKLAAAIARKGDNYAMTPMGGKVLVNNQPLKGRSELRDGDILQVSGLTLQFRLKG